MVDDDADVYLSRCSTEVGMLGRVLHARLLREGCESYVKTIYVGYEIDGEMVAALYARTNHVEIALALEEDHPAPALKDASHLTWRTLPLALEVRTEADLDLALALITEASNRIRSGSHGVERGNEFFIRSRKARLAREQRDDR